MSNYLSLVMCSMDFDLFMVYAKLFITCNVFYGFWPLYGICQAIYHL